MSPADRKLVDDAIQTHGDTIQAAEENIGCYSGWIVKELLEILAKDDLDLKVVRLDK